MHSMARQREEGEPRKGEGETYLPKLPARLKEAVCASKIPSMFVTSLRFSVAALLLYYTVVANGEYFRLPSLDSCFGVLAVACILPSSSCRTFCFQVYQRVP